MKSIFTLLFWLLCQFAFSQISFFKELNTVEEGSNPANFIEVNGTTYFTVKAINKFELWKTDGTEIGTVKFSDKSISIQNQGATLKTFQVLNNELYYFVNNSLTTRQLWKTNGTDEILVLDNIFPTKLYNLNNQLCYFDYQGLYKIENGTSTRIKDLTLNNVWSQPPPIQIDNQVIFFTNQSGVSGRIQVWKTDGTEGGTSSIKNIDSLYYLPTNDSEYENFSTKIANKAFFVLKRLLTNPNGSYFQVTELWESNGIITNLVKRISTTNGCCSDNARVFNMAEFNGKLIFIYDNSKLWISDGTSPGTYILTNNTNYDTYNKKWGILNDKFYFSAINGSDTELWQSDGSILGTFQLKDLNTSSSSNPNYFVNIDNKLFFKANSDEIWQTDGTVSGTTFIQSIPKPDDYPSSYYITPEFIYTSNNQLFFKNYDPQNDFELWKSDGTATGTTLLKNIATHSKSGMGSDKKIKVGNIWYFVGTDHRGSELWKTDGTPEGTSIVKDITVGVGSTSIQEFVAIGNIIYFTTYSPTTYNWTLYKSDGTQHGTFGLFESSHIDLLTAGITKLYFRALGVPYVHDINTLSVRPIASTYIYNSTPDNFLTVSDKLYFKSNGLWVSDGTQANTFSITNLITVNRPSNPICLIEFQGKIFFFSSYFNSSTSYGEALYQSDGTAAGTTIVKDFGQNTNLTSNYLLFLEKSADRLYFRAGYNNTFGNEYFNLWTSDGTNSGTYQLARVPFTSNTIFRFISVANQFFMFIGSQVVGRPVDLWMSTGTINDTKLIYKYDYTIMPYDYINFNNKLYFSIYHKNYGVELWTTNGTNDGTYLVEEVRVGESNSWVSTMMNFNDKLIFAAYDNLKNKELWQYLPISCEGNRNFTIDSGSWDTSSIWSCGRTPTQDDIVIIKNPHSVTIPNNYQTIIKRISTETGSVLSIPSSSVISIKSN